MRTLFVAIAIAFAVFGVAAILTATPIRAAAFGAPAEAHLPLGGVS